MSTPSNQARAIFLEAIEQPVPEKRAEFIALACGADADLRARVERLLRSHELLGSFHDAAPLADVTIEQPSLEQAGAQIGPYKLLQQIGEGGMGTVYMAEQTEPVQRKVALKLIKPGMDSRQVISRFEAERQALALMDHPNIAKVIDAGTTESGRPYFVMELVKGVPVTRYCDEHRLTPNQRLELFISVCQAVQHAHQKGVIHRDLKPSNVLVAEYDDRPVAKVIDFGVAKATGQKLTERTMFTELGQIVGTLEYMSPEQAKLNALDIDTRSDIYALGVLLYELLTGSTPLEKTRFCQAAFDEMLRIIREEEPPRPSTRLSTTDELPSISANRGLEPKKLSALVRGELDWIVMKALEKDRNRRYETANGFAVDIQRYLADEPVLACPPSAVYRLRKFARRNKATLTFASLILLFLVVLGSGVGWMVRDRGAREEEFAQKRETREREITLEQEARKAALNREVDRALEEADQLGVQEKWPEALEAVERAEKLLAAADRRDRPPHLVALQTDLTMAQRLEDIYRNPQRDPTVAARPGQAEMPGGLSPAERAAEEEVFAGREQDARFAAAFQEFGIDADALETPEAAARIGRTNIGPALVKALDDWAAMRRRARGDGDAGWKKLVEIARSADRDKWRNKFRGALLARDRQALEKLAGEVSPRDVPPATLLLLADTLKQLGALEKAIEVLRQAQRQYPDDLWLNDALASTYVNECRPPRHGDALRFYTVASALRPRSARWHVALGRSFVATKASEEGLAEWSRAIDLQPDDGMQLWRRATLYNFLGQPDKALSDVSKAIELQPDNREFRSYRATCYEKMRQWDKAITDYSKLIELKPDDADVRVKRAQSYRSQGDGQKAQADFSEAVHVYTKAIELKPDDASLRRGRAAAHMALGKMEEYFSDFSKAIELKPDNWGLWIERGIYLMNMKRWDEALSDFSKAIELQPDNSAGWSNRGSLFWNLKQWDKAASDFSKASELNPDNLVTLFSRAQCYREMRQWEKAIADYSKVIEMVIEGDRPGSDYYYPRIAWFQRRVAQLELGQWDQAVTAFAEPLLRQPKTSSQWEDRAQKFMGLTLWPEAAADYAKAFELGEPTDIRTFAVHALLRRFLQDGPGYRDACRRMLARFAEPTDPGDLEVFAKVLAVDPEPVVEPSRIIAIAERAVANNKSVANVANLGLACYRAREFDRAKAALESLQVSTNGFVPSTVYSTFAMVQHRLANADEASAALAKARSERERFFDVMLRVELGVTVYSSAFNNFPYEKVLYEVLYQEAYALIHGSPPPEDARWLVLRGRGLEAIGRADEAQALFARAFALQPEDLLIRVRAMPHVSRTDAYARGLAGLRMFLKEHPNQPDESRLALARAHLQWGARQWEAGRRPEAEAMLDHAVEVAPQNAQLLLERGNLWLSSNEAARAIGDYSKVLEQSEDAGLKSVVYQQRGLAHSRLGRHAEARDDLQQAVDLAPNSAEAHNSLAWLLANSLDAALRDPQRAVALAAKAVEMQPTLGTYWNTLGIAHYRVGDWHGAIEALTKSRELKNSAPAFDWFFLAMAEWRQGNKDEARRWYDQAAAWRAQNARDNEELQRCEVEAKEVLEVN